MSAFWNQFRGKQTTATGSAISALSAKLYGPSSVHLHFMRANVNATEIKYRNLQMQTLINAHPV